MTRRAFMRSIVGAIAGAAVAPVVAEQLGNPEAFQWSGTTATNGIGLFSNQVRPGADLTLESLQEALKLYEKMRDEAFAMQILGVGEPHPIVYKPRPLRFSV